MLYLKIEVHAPESTRFPHFKMLPQTTLLLPISTPSPYSVRSRKDLSPLPSDSPVIYKYGLRFEVALDVIVTLSLLDKKEIAYTIPEKNSATAYELIKGQLTDERSFFFDSPCPIHTLREALDSEMKDIDTVIESLDYIDDFTGELYFRRYLNSISDPERYHDYSCRFCEDSMGGFDHRKCQGLIPYDCEECHDYYTDHRICQGETPEEIAYEDYCRSYRFPDR
jgi:hypothetical protein